MGRNSQEIKEKKLIKSDLGPVKTGKYIESMRTINLWGCKSCSFYATLLCPHGCKDGIYHPKNICSYRVLYIKEKIVYKTILMSGQKIILIIKF